MEEMQEKQNEEGVKIVAALQETLMQGFLTAISIVGVITAGVGTYEAIQATNFWLIPIYWISYFTALLFTFWKKPSYKLRAWTLVGLLYLIGTTDFIADGIGGSGRLFLLSLVFITGILFGRRESIAMVIANALTLIGFGIVFSTGAVSIPGDGRSSLLGIWIVSIVPLTMLGLLIMVSLNFLIPRLVTALQNSHQLTNELQINQDTLTQQVQERTEKISRRSSQLEAITFIGRDVMSIQNQDQMLNEAVNLISNQLGFYFAGIFLSDEINQYAILQAATSKGGHQLLMSRYRVYIGETNFVGSVISRGTVRFRNFEIHGAEFSETPELADTRSQIVIPLKARDQIIGALDIQSREVEEFDEDSTKVIQILADQLALSIMNSRLYEEAQQSLNAAQRAYGQISQQAWSNLISRQQIRKRFDPQKILADNDGWSQKTLQASQDGKMVLEKGILAIPIKERGQVIGLIRAHKASEKEVWSQEEINLINNLTDQLEVALESARLYKDTQLLAEQERLVGEITARMRESLDVESVLRTAVQEIGEKLGLSSAEVWLSDDTNLESTTPR